MNKPKKTFVLRLDPRDWLEDYPWNFEVIGFNFHSCNNCNNIRVTILGVSLMIGFADIDKLRIVKRWK